MMDSSTTTTTTTPLSHRSKSRSRLLPNACTTTTTHNIDHHHPTETPNNSPLSSSNINNNNNADDADADAAIKVVSLQDHFLLLSSPPPPYRKPTILLDEASLVLDVSQQQSAATPRRRGGGKSSRATAASPRNNVRRARRRLEKDIINAKDQEKEMVVLPLPPYGGEDVIGGDGGGGGGRVTVIGKRKQTRSKVSHKDKLWLVPAPPLPSASPSPSPSATAAAEDDNSHQCMDNSKWELIRELVMWKNVAKSTLWFGLGSMFFLSCCFSGDFSFSLISAASHLGILVLGLAFFYDSVPQRQRQKPRRANFQLTEEDILRTGRLIMPMANAVLAKSQEVFSGEPLMTLKVAPILIFTAKYGHLITPWRLLATGFFLSFTIPKLYSCYSERIQKRVEEMRSYVLEAWKSCPRKNLVASSIAMVLWNMFSVKTRIFAAFISVVVLRHHHHHIGGGKSDAE